MTTPGSALSERERQIYRAYDDTWQLRLTSIIAPFFGIVTFLCLIGLLAYLVSSATRHVTPTNALPPQVSYFCLFILAVVTALYGYSTYAAR
ncbi:MAG TPA: hypothetical protein VKQ36_10090, partial [Ktedonobacterales bacterium]|nr:hypothetical protein [Ktedonobacterales bacterium]